MTTETFAENCIALGGILLMQSTLILGAGLFLSHLLRNKGALPQLSVLRVMLCALVACPFVSQVLRMTDAASLWPFVLSLFLGTHDAPALAVAAAAPALTTSIGVSATAPLWDMTTWPARSGGGLLVVFCGAWLLISALLLLRFAKGYWRIAGVRTAATPAPREVQYLCRRLADELGMSAPPVMMTARVTSPILVGILRPVILLPQSGLPGGAGALRYVLIHELTHALHRDCLWTFIGRALLASLFFQPLLYVFLRRLDTVSDDLADDYVVRWGGGGTDYAGLLTDLAERYASVSLEFAGAGVVAFHSSLGRRVQRILDKARRITLAMSHGAVGAMIVAGVAVTLAAAIIGCGENTAQAQAAAPAPSTASETQAPAFVDDPGAVGVWESVDFVKTVEDFQPGKKTFGGDLYLKGLEIMPGGRTSGPWSWSKGVLYHPGDKTNAHYTIKDIGGVKYFFMEWMSGDVTIRGMKPRYYVMQFKGASTAKAVDKSPIDPRQYQSEQAPPFVDDPSVIGRWESVDFVGDPGDFAPGQKKWTGDLFLTKLEFQPQGHMVSYAGAGKSYGGMLWSNGQIWHPNDHSLAKYRIATLQNDQYLFLEWISGDVTVRDMKPWYYVLKKVE